LVDRLYSGEIDPPTPESLLKYRAVGVISECGKDAADFAWAYRDRSHATVAV
jgi:hypothetical protein